MLIKNRRKVNKDDQEVFGARATSGLRRVVLQANGSGSPGASSSRSADHAPSGTELLAAAALCGVCE